MVILYQFVYLIVLTCYTIILGSLVFLSNEYAGRVFRGASEDLFILRIVGQSCTTSSGSSSACGYQPVHYFLLVRLVTQM